MHNDKLNHEIQPQQIEITITQEENGKRITKDTTIAFEAIPDLEKILNDMGLDVFFNRPQPQAPPQKKTFAKQPKNNTAIMPNRGFLGVCIDKNYDSLGVKIEDIIPNGAACKAGLLTNDLIYAINGSQIDNFDALRYVIAGLRANDTIMIDFERQGEHRNIEAILQPEKPVQSCNPTMPTTFPFVNNDDRYYSNIIHKKQQYHSQQVVNANQVVFLNSSYCGRMAKVCISDLNSSDYKRIKAMDIKKTNKNLPLQALQINFDHETYYLSLTFEMPDIDQTAICLIDANGQMLFSENFSEFGGIYARSIYLPNKQQSPYYLAVKQGKKQYIKRISF